MCTDAPEARRKYGLGKHETYGLAILHPETFKTTDENYLMARAMFAALEETGIRTIVVYPCSDPGYQGIIQAIDEVRNNPLFSIHKNIENLDFLGLMSSAAFLIGNSSSALVEAPYFHLLAVNIGKRQEGRDREENVIDCNPVKEEIVESLLYAMKDNNFKKTLKSCGYRLGDGRASEKILHVLKTVPLDKKLLQKRITY